MRITFRARMLGLVGIAALAFMLLVIASNFISRRVQDQLTTIQNEYVPKLDLEPRLEGALEGISRGLQDAVAARDPTGLAGVDQLESRFLAELDSARGALSPEDAEAVKRAMQDYYAAAVDVSRRLLTNETGEALVDRMTAMQTKLEHLKRVLRSATRIDREELGRAFASAARAEADAGAYRLWIAVSCLATVFLLSLVLSRSLLRSLAELTSGFRRFGAGDFGQPIPAGGGDELADVAQHANQMAESLDRTRTLLLKARSELESKVEERTAQLSSVNTELRESQAALKEMNAQLEHRVEVRTSQLALSNKELEAFSYSVAHDLRAPLRGVSGFAEVLADYDAKLDDSGRDCLHEILNSAREMAELIDALLSLSRVTRASVRTSHVDFSELVRSVLKDLTVTQPRTQAIELSVQDSVQAEADPHLARAVFENLLGNAWKFTSKVPAPHIEFGTSTREGQLAYFVRDNGAGFDEAYAQKLFAPFQRLHTASEFPGTGIGLATVQRIVHRHGGRIWAEGSVGKGAAFYFTLGAPGAQGDLDEQGAASG